MTAVPSGVSCSAARTAGGSGAPHDLSDVALHLLLQLLHLAREVRGVRAARSEAVFFDGVLHNIEQDIHKELGT